MEYRELNSKEEWTKLSCDIIPEGSFIVTSLSQDHRGTKIILEDGHSNVEIFFDGIPLLVRQAIEGVRMRTWEDVQLKYRDKFYFSVHFWYEVKNSLLIEWLQQEGYGFYKKDNITHYCIVTSEELIDILVEFEPTVRVESLST